VCVCWQRISANDTALVTFTVVEYAHDNPAQKTMRAVTCSLSRSLTFDQVETRSARHRWVGWERLRRNFFYNRNRMPLIIYDILFILQYQESTTVMDLVVVFALFVLCSRCCVFWCYRIYFRRIKIYIKEGGTRRNWVIAFIILDEFSSGTYNWPKRRSAIAA